MEQVRKLENMIEGWLKPLPHLPAQWRKWLTENVWWITLLGVVLSVFGVIAMVGAIFTAMNFVNSVNNWYNALGIANTTIYTNWWYISSFVSLAFLALTIALEAMAVTPLKAQKRKGWELMFLVFLLGVASQVVNLVLNFGNMSVVTSSFGIVIGTVVGAYFLFELRSGFKSTSEVK